MQNYKHGGHTIWDCKYHLVWVTKYRYEVLEGDIGLRCRELLR
ncbi:MAG: IS200/IS605 family transposase, partial [Gammaproteobacteria bacterium]|nr:IS200/IS605 family transposase [Gammaproteobacteria bacterium]